MILLLAAGLEFPDAVGVEAIASSDFSAGAVLPPITGSSAVQQPKTAPIVAARVGSSSAPLPPQPVASSTSAAARPRGMSFECFSFGINADEPLPPPTSDAAIANKPRGDSISYFPSPAQQRRPRGDSIIFDPISFQDGGIHEEKALMKSSRTNTSSVVDMPGSEEVALMNAPGFVTAPPPPAMTASSARYVLPMDGCQL